ncbi:TetR/AcrR family transcriptional regulator [Mycetocola spongiae]|uniref:TetR/AcrR family transcriptional regulator n=1 Tax=Mycetocola spongiae TaxID=2859226 RepID=UPI001CF476E0|nr:TetR/AcrR family transcriptional regulator [Mycetocola spongiae]UCR89340.1 TetR/AcrR family transcriptional regulator [Mycetocola spongiae]
MAQTPTAPRVGRPRRSSQQMLEDAAAELFLEQGYAATAIEQITQRAGVSRNTFFNYFGVKSDLLWIDLDRSIALLPAALAESPREAGAARLDALAAAVLAVAARHPADRVPWALSQADLMGTRAELEASALARLTAQTRAIEAFLEGWSGRARIRAVACVSVGAVAAGLAEWIDAGVRRDPLNAYIAAALLPALAGFREES